MSQSLKKAFSLILGFFLILWAGIAYTLTLAFTHFEPVIDPDYSIKKPATQLSALEQSRAAWALTSPVFSRDQIAIGTLNVPLTLSPKAAKTIARGVIEIKLERPATRRGGFHQLLSLKDARLDAQGNYHFDLQLPVPAPGFWELEAKAQIEGERRVYVQHRMYAR